MPSPRPDRGNALEVRARSGRTGRALFHAESIVSAAWFSGRLVPADLFSSWGGDGPGAGTPFVLAAFDEVGRGCLAGPVVAGCTLWAQGTPTEAFTTFLAGVDDSKRLTEAKRRTLFDASTEHIPVRIRLGSQDDDVGSGAGAGSIGGMCADAALPTPEWELVPPHNRGAHDFDALARCRTARSFVCLGAGVAHATPREIDAFNIWHAVQLAMARALHLALDAAGGQEGGAWPCVVVVDGKTPIKVPPLLSGVPQVTAVGGDGRFTSIGLASVLAKVARDDHMVALAARHPAYGFEKHKGYGTPEHLEALRAHAPIPSHRLSFLRSLV